MKLSNKAGFTIIETMLFLSITGLMAAGILVGTGSSINTQRYHDSVTSLQSLLQQQFSEVNNVNNDHTNDLSCDPSSAKITTNASNSIKIGQSECVILGRYIVIDNGNISISSVVGYKDSALSVATDDVIELKAYKLSVLGSSTETSQLEWGAKIAWPVVGNGSQSAGNPRLISLLALRSPVSGLVYVFNDNSDNLTSLQNMIVASGDEIPGRSMRRICIDSNGGFDGGLSIVIGKYASGTNSIQTQSNEQIKSNDNSGNAPQC